MLKHFVTGEPTFSTVLNQMQFEDQAVLWHRNNRPILKKKPKNNVIIFVNQNGDFLSEKKLYYLFFAAIFRLFLMTAGIQVKDPDLYWPK